MKILMFGWEFPPHISGGLGTACYGLTKGLMSIGGVDLTFVVPKAYGNEDVSGMKFIGANEVEMPDEVIRKQKALELQKLNEFYQRVSAYISPEQYKNLILKKQEEVRVQFKDPSSKLPFTGKYGTDLIDEILRYGVVASVIAKNEPHEVIHAHDWLTYPAGIQAKKASKKPLVVHVHATEYDRSGENHNKSVFKIEQEGMQYADQVIAVSNLTRKTVIEKYKINPAKVVTVHNAVEAVKNISQHTNFWKTETNEKIVTFLGRITWQKGPEFFVEAARKVLQRMDNVRFVMAGNGDLMHDMVLRVARAGIANKFHFTDFLKGDDVSRMYAMSDLYIMPSVSEPFGISPLEALQNNVPVIISKQSGVAEVIKNAIKIDFWDVDAMADAIYGVLKYSSLSDNLRKNGKREVDRLTWKKAAVHIRNIYNKVQMQ